MNEVGVWVNLICNNPIYIVLSKWFQADQVGCTCHDFMNNAGYGQCRKRGYKHDYTHVCYVNQPSNCSDMYASITDPGKKVSAEACAKGNL